MATRSIEELRRCDLLPRWMRFVIVNERIPRANACCAECKAKIERGYVRDPNTTRFYCDAQCFDEHTEAERAATLFIGQISSANSWILAQRSPRA